MNHKRNCAKLRPAMRNCYSDSSGILFEISFKAGIKVSQVHLPSDAVRCMVENKSGDMLILPWGLCEELGVSFVNLCTQHRREREKRTTNRILMRL